MQVFSFFCLFQKMEYSVHRKRILKNHNVIFVGSKWESLIHDRSKSGFFRLFESET
ncbi:hypothetical protein LEP1GSC137_2838 [Leptospira borgpetersenii str. Noumea 25]|nr:hypothetical protein LBBP_03500 [Leptospira borgpetersenii serovar Ballum]EKQ99884.1 hypothetical protein LEP1GSC121_1818 [Leptospira borgpetersenii serovar Castellonis str. 200801910]EMN14563.1 hypothetical protein LEP1GSC055_4210 [Leptospira borgpetersenii str. Brem 307]EMN15953.1 hypothetical protein LEP1GSC056_0744 [Leptospira borgpetersenii str. Brem 328]EMO11739.1 hypothetical protein LEP1GSC137_2838 [Leptospira borgpetersenii str. Noumea 25]